MTVSKPRPWLFALTGVPYGVSGGFVSFVMPFVAKHAEVDLDDIGWYTALLFVPTFFQFLYAPVVDIGPGRRYWLVIMSAIGGICLGASFLQNVHDSRAGFLAFAFGGQVLLGLVGSCNGGLMATNVPDHLRGKAGAAYNVGNLSGGAVYAWAAIELVDNDLSWLAGLVTVAMALLPSTAVLLMSEPPPVARAATEPNRFRSMLRDVRDVIFSKSGITGILLSLSPVGTAALSNSFTAMTDDYHASGRLVAAISGPGNAFLTAIGAAITGKLCDRYSRRGMYLLSGALTAVCGLAITFFPHNNVTYSIGVSVYYLIMGMCFASFTATVLETIGHGDAAAATKYTLFTAAGNVAIAYVGLINTRFYAPHKVGDTTIGNVDALFKSDAILNLGGVAVLGFVFWRLGAFGKTKHPTETLAT